MVDEPVEIHLVNTVFDGVVLVGGPDGPTGTQPVRFTENVTYHVDPIDPVRLFRVEVGRPESVGWLLDELLGDGTTRDIVLRPPALTVRPTAVSGDVARLGLLLWLEEHSPMNLDQGLLDAEIAAACDVVPGAAAVAETRRRAERSVDVVIELGQLLRDDPGRVRSSAALVIARAAGAAVAAVRGLTRAEIRSLTDTDVAASAVATASQAAGSIDSDMLALLSLSPQARAIDWGGLVGSSDMGRERRYSVDWRLVPRGVLDIAENTIVASWGDDSSSVALTVAAGPDAAVADEPLQARLLRGHAADIVAVARLTLDPAAATYRASVDVPGGLRPDDRIDVFSPAAMIDPLRGSADIARAEGVRYAARGLSLTRLALATADSPAAAGLWVAAAAEWSAWLESAERFSTDASIRRRDGDVVRAARARCLQGQGLSGPADRTLSRVNDISVIPRWADPSASPSLAELRLLGML